MIASRFHFAMIFGSLFANPSALRAQTPSAPSSNVEQFEGIYRFSAYREVIITPLTMGSRKVLLLADIGTDELRVLAPTGDNDRFTAGPALTNFTPPRESFRFMRDGTGNIVALERTGADTAGAVMRAEVGRLIPTRAIPARFNNDSVTLNGALVLPTGKGPFPAVVFAHGSEASDRHSFGPVPLALVAHGFAVLLYDKRGTGSSSGSWRTVGIEPLGDDLIAGIHWLGRQRLVDRKRIGIFGSSEGGWVAAYAAARARDVAFVITASGGALTKADAFVHKTRKQMESSGASPFAVDTAVRHAAAVADSSRARGHNPDASGFDRRLAYDPTSDWIKYRGPALHLEGEFDVLEPGPRSAEWYADLDRRAGRRDVTVKLFPKAHHSLLQGVTGTAGEFESGEGIRQMATGYWDVLLRWLGTHLPVRSR